MSKRISLTEKIFRDREGNIVIGQFPNLPLVVWLGCTVLSSIVSSTESSDKISTFGTIFAFIWAYLEITQGVNLFRKVLGAIVFVALSIGIIM